MRDRKKTGRKYDVGLQLIEQIKTLSDESISVEMIRERAWASITFTGTRHQIAIKCKSENSRAIIAKLHRMLPAHEFASHANFVADCTAEFDNSVENSHQKLLVEILTISDPVR